MFPQLLWLEVNVDIILNLSTLLVRTSTTLNAPQRPGNHPRKMRHAIGFTNQVSAIIGALPETHILGTCWGLAMMTLGLQAEGMKSYPATMSHENRIPMKQPV